MGLDRPLEVTDEGHGSLKTVVADLNRRFGPTMVRYGGAGERGGLETGVLCLDALFPGGGLPRERLSWVTGRAGEGVFDLGLALLARISRTLPVAVVDFDMRVDPGDIADYGGALENCWLVRPRLPEQGWAAARSVILGGVDFCLLLAHSWQQLSRSVPALLVAALEERGAVGLLGGGAAIPPSLRGRVAMELSCRREGWVRAHRDVVGVELSLSVVRSRLGPLGGECRLVVGFPRAYPSPVGVVERGQSRDDVLMRESLMEAVGS